MIYKYTYSVTLKLVRQNDRAKQRTLASAEPSLTTLIYKFQLQRHKTPKKKKKLLTLKTNTQHNKTKKKKITRKHASMVFFSFLFFSNDHDCFFFISSSICVLPSIPLRIFDQTRLILWTCVIGLLYIKSLHHVVCILLQYNSNIEIILRCKQSLYDSDGSNG